MLVRRLVCLLPAACCLLSLLAAAPGQAALIGRSTEISLGREAAEEYESQESIDTDLELATRVNRIGQRLIAAAPATEYPFEFHAVQTNGINAFALPGGFVYIYSGLAQLVPGDDALAFILAHEISHVTQHHGIRQIEASLALGVLIDVALHRGTAGDVLHLALTMRHSRHDETEADRLGLELMTRAGFDPAAGAKAMEVVARAAGSGRSIPALLRSHPLPESRIAALRRQAEILRAAPRPPRDVAAAPPLPTPVPLAPAPVLAVPSELFPLQVGMRWTYRVSGGATRQNLTTTVLEEHPDQRGVFRLRSELDTNLSITRLLTVTPKAILVYRSAQESAERDRPAAEPGRAPLPASAWQPEIDLPADLRTVNSSKETVRVPAGEFQAVRAIQRSPDGRAAATVWLAPGVGLVKRSWEGTGLVEELETFRRPPAEGEGGAKGG